MGSLESHPACHVLLYHFVHKTAKSRCQHRLTLDVEPKKLKKKSTESTHTRVTVIHVYISIAHHCYYTRRMNVVCMYSLCIVQCSFASSHRTKNGQ